MQVLCINAVDLFKMFLFFLSQKFFSLFSFSFSFFVNLNRIDVSTGF